MTDKEMNIAANAIHNFLEEKQEDLKYKLMNTLRKNIEHLANDNFNVRIINDLKNTFGEEMKMDFKELNKPIKLKKPFSMKIKEFLNKINNVLGL